MTSWDSHVTEATQEPGLRIRSLLLSLFLKGLTLIEDKSNGVWYSHRSILAIELVIQEPSIPSNTERQTYELGESLHLQMCV